MRVRRGNSIVEQKTATVVGVNDEQKNSKRPRTPNQSAGAPSRSTRSGASRSGAGASRAGTRTGRSTTGGALRPGTSSRPAANTGGQSTRSGATTNRAGASARGAGSARESSATRRGASTQRGSSTQRNSAAQNPRSFASQRTGSAQRSASAQRPASTARSNARPTAATPKKRSTRQETVQATRQEAGQAQWKAHTRTIITWVLGGLLLVGVAVFAINYAIGKVDNYSAVEDPAKAFDPVPCTADILDIGIEGLSGSTADGALLTVTLTNMAEKSPCYINVGYKSFGFQIESGNQVIFDSRVCQVGNESKRLLINPGSSGKTSVSWNGMNRGGNCTGNSYAGDGMYVLNLFSGNEQLLDQGAIFQITSGSIVTLAQGVPASEANDDETDPVTETDPAPETDSAPDSDQVTGEDSPGDSESADTTQ